MPPTRTATREDAQIRARIDTLAQALRAKDIDALMAHYAPDVVTFDLPPLQTQGADAYRNNFEAWFASVQGPIDYEIHDLRITMRATSICRCRSPAERPCRLRLRPARVATHSETSKAAACPTAPASTSRDPWALCR